MKILEVSQIKSYVPQALEGVAHLIVAEAENNEPLGFMGIENQRLEMLFLSPTERGKGLGILKEKCEKIYNQESQFRHDK